MHNRSESVLSSDKLSELTEAWRIDGIGGVAGTPAVVNGVIYFGDWHGVVHTVWYISWNTTSPSAEDRLTISQRSIEEAFRLQRHRNESDQARGCNPARMTVTSRRTAALDGRLLAAVRAWRQ